MLTRKKVLLCILMAIVMLMTVACSTINNNNKPQKEDTSFNVIYHNQKIDNVDISENWLENYVSNNTLNLSDTDKVNVIIEVEGKSLLDRYLSQSTYLEMKDYAISADADAAIVEMEERQNDVKAIIDAREISVSYRNSYTALFNGFSATVNYGDIEKLEELSFVNRVIVCEEYAVPDAAAIENIQSTMAQTGLFTNNTGYNGEGMIVAVVDTGVDYKHPAFSQTLTNGALNLSDIEAVASSLYGNKHGKSYAADKLYYSSKVPFQYDYADNDNNAIPNPYVVNTGSAYHGTHVAGIVAGYSEEENVIGAAYNAQIAAMKVFSDKGGGAATDVIISALSDCAILGVDVINMSLGTPAGFSFERYEDLFYINEMYQLLDKLGISVIVSSGNSYSQAIINIKGATDPSNPDSGFVGSPSTYCSSVTIASINAYQTSWFWHNETEKVYMKSAVKPDSSSYNCEDMILNGNDSYTFDIVPVPNAGEESDYNGLDVTGKTVLVQRGKISFEDKQKIAAKLGAKACIIYNNEERALFGAQINELVIPTFTILMEDGITLITDFIENNKAELTLNRFSANYSMSDFSSWGCVGDLTLKPEISAPGGNIYSTFPLSYSKGKYGYLSGTSMAAPNFAAVNAVVRQYIKENFPSLTNKEIRTLSYQLLMSTTNLAVDDYGVIVSPRKQGAGVADVNAAVNTKAYLTVTGSDRTKLELGDDKNRDGIYTLNFNLVNFDTRALSYDINAIVMTETVVNGLTAERGHLFTDRKLNISAKNAAINGTIVTVEAGETAKITITITLTEEEKAYLEELFINGMYVEGFATLTAIEEDSEDLSIPFLAFYGDWTDAPIFDKTLFTNEEPYITYLYFVGNYRTSYRMGDYQYALPDGAEKSPASLNKIALSFNNDANSTLVTVMLPLLRNVTELYYTIYDELTGEEYYNGYGYNIRKTYWNNGQGVLSQHKLNINANDFDWMNNQRLVFQIEGSLDYEGRNKTQVLKFPLYIDGEKASVVDSKVRIEDDRTYVDVTVYDNHILQDYFISTVNDEGIIVNIGNPFPVYEKDWKVNENNVITMDITNYISKLNNGKLAIILDDCAYNQSAYYLCDVSAEENPEAENNNTYKADFIENVDTFIADNGDVFTTSETSMTANNAIVCATGEEHKFTVVNNQLVAYSGPGGEIVIPEGVTSIGEGVFLNNFTITKVTMPEGLISIGSQSFNGCAYITEIVFPSTLEEVGYKAFAGCRRVEKMNLEDTNVYFYDKYAFYGLESLKELILPKADKDIEIGMSAFSVLVQCESVKIYGNIAKFTETFIVLPNCKSIQFYGDIIANITSTSFVAMDSLELIEFHGNVNNIGNNSVTPVIFSHLGSLKKVEFFGNVEGITSVAFSYCLNLEEVIFHGYLNKLNRQYAFGLSKLTRFTVAEDNQYMIMDEATGIMYNKEKMDHMYMPSSWDYDGVFELSEKIQTLEACQFSHSSHTANSFNYVYKVTDTNASHSIAYGRVYYTQSRTLLKGVKLHSAIKELPLYCFYDNENLVSVENIENVTKLGNYAFARCKSLTEMNTPNVTSIGGYAFQACSSLKEYTMPLKITSIGTFMFEKCSSLEKITLNNAKNIGASAFKDCVSLKNIELNAKAASLGSRAFMNCSALESINMGTALTSIGSEAFSNCTALKTVNMPDTVKTLSKSAFYNCSALEKITLSNKITAIPEKAFYNCSSLYEVNFPAGVKTLGAYAFANTALINVVLPDALLDFDPMTTFEGCLKLESITVSENSVNMKTVDGVLYSKDMGIVILYPIAKKDVSLVLDDAVKSINSYAFQLNQNLKSIEMPNVVAIDDYAFIGSAIETVIGEKITEIGMYAFNNSAIKSINLSNCKAIDDYAFANAEALTEININNIEYLGAYSFMNTGVKEVVLPDSMEYILSRAFADCNQLSKVTIGKDCDEFNFSSVFANDNIREIVIEEGNNNFILENGILYDIDKEIVFDYIGSETDKIVIAEGVRKISAYAFMNSSITEVEMPKTLEVIGEKAFYGIETLKTFIFHSEKAPRLECQYDADRRLYYSNFITEIEKLAENNIELNIYHPANNSYHNYIYETYFANRYEESEEGYIKLNVKVSDVNNMMEDVVNGNTALIAEASKLYSMMTETQKSCVNNSEMLNINDMALAVKANDNIYIAIAALFSSLVAFAVIAIKKR